MGESRRRAVGLQPGLPMPDLHVVVRCPNGLLIGRCDFGWEENRLLGECDGRVKYGRLLRRGRDAGDVVLAESRREDALRDEGWGMVRWVGSELDTPRSFRRRIAERLEHRN